MSKIKIFALGGLNEDGKNMYVIEVDNDIFVFDAGLKYADDHLFGIDYIIPDFRYLKNNINRVKGIFLTHGHDENIGALPEIINELPNIKVYGTKFTIDIVRKMLEEDGHTKINNLIEIVPHRKINFDHNSVFPIRLTHSIPDNVGYALYTEDGVIFYTGNFVFDPTMTGSYKTDIGKLAYIGKQGVLCLLSESLYAEKRGFTSPHHRISNMIRETLDKKPNRLIFNVVSANMYRVQELFYKVMKTNRKVVIMGKRLQRMINNLINMKYIDFNKNKIGDLSNINDKDVIILISSENEKPFSNLNRIV
ncbi:MAG: ribonuclease J, partial [Bacilli bacterium]|nr:ribonuclease J [Bacilli bacterium]